MSVLAIYRNRVYMVADNLAACQLEGGPTLCFGDAELVLDPTDRQLAEVENLGEFYDVKGTALVRLRRELLRG